MLKILAILISGVLLGVLLRGRLPLRWVAKGTSVLIYLLLLVLGIAVGSNQIIVKNLGTIGVKGALIALAAVVGSLVMAKILYHTIKIGREGER